MAPTVFYYISLTNLFYSLSWACFFPKCSVKMLGCWTISRRFIQSKKFQQLYCICLSIKLALTFVSLFFWSTLTFSSDAKNGRLISDHQLIVFTVTTSEFFVQFLLISLWLFRSNSLMEFFAEFRALLSNYRRTCILVERQLLLEW